MVQADGKILVVGSSRINDHDSVFVVRYNNDGSLDNTFDVDGKVTTSLDSLSYLSGKSVTVQVDGKILVAGLSQNDMERSFAQILIRYNDNGSLDTTFDTDGKVITPISFWGTGLGKGVAVQTDGKIIVAGSDGGGVFLTRYNNDGSLDTSFDRDGIVTTSNVIANSVAIQANGKLLVAGFGGFSRPFDFALNRYNVDGGLDLSFNSVDTLANTIVATELNKPVTIAPTVDVFDADLYDQKNYNNAHLTLQRHGASNVSDIFGTSSPISFANGALSYSGTSIGTVTQSNGKLDLTFNSNATQSVVTTTLRNLTYKNVGNGAAEQITLDWTFSDGNTGSQGDGGVGTVTGSSVVNITDLTPPSVNNFSPTQNANNVALNSDITLTFSEAIQRGTGNIVLKNSIGTVIATYDAATSTNLTFSGDKLTINPSADLAISTRYIVDVANGVVKDLSGNVFAGRSGYQFDTGTSSATNINHLPTGDVSLYGDEPAKEGWSLLVGNNLSDVDGLGVISYQWLRNNVAVPGETDFSYTLTSADVGKTISVRATYTDLLGNVESVTSRATASVLAEFGAVNHAPTGSITILGNLIQGGVLTVSGNVNDVDGMGTVHGQWYRNGLSVATDVSYILTQADVGKSISAIVSYTDGLGKLENVTSNTVKIANVNDAPTGAISISGSSIQGQILTASNSLADVDGLGVVSYQWLNNGTIIKNANQETYTLTSADAGKTISVKASYTDLQGTKESVSSESTSAVISTKPTKGDDLLTGTVKNNTLSALAGNDTLIGGLGADKLTGGKGADTFTFTSLDDSGITAKTRDTITDFKHGEGDKIDLSGLGFNSFIGSDAFSTDDATGQLRFDAKTHILYGSTNSDNKPEFSILLSGVKSLVIEDLVL